METQAQESTMTLDQFRAMKESGMTAEQEAQPEAQDAAVQEEPETEPEEIDAEASSEPQDEPEGTEEIELPEEQKTAFQKALEREKRKAREEAEKKIKQELEQQYNPYKKFFDNLGMDPEAALQAMEENRVRQEAARMAEQNGWDDEQTQWYIKQQQLEREQMDMRVSLRVYELADSPDYPGIKAMKGAISEFVRANPRASVEQAYWAVGGQSLAQQLKREAEQREIAKRSQTARKVVTDSGKAAGTTDALPPEATEFMRRTGMSEEQVRWLMKDGPRNLDEYRKLQRRK